MSAALRSFTNFIFHGRSRAIGISFILTFIPLIGTLSIVITGLVTLRKGAVEGLWVLIAATLPYFVLLPLQPLPLNLWILGVIVVSNLLTWVFAALLYHYDNWSFIFELAALIGIMIITSAHVIKPDLDSFWEKQLNTYLTQALSGNSNGKALPSFVQQLNASKARLLGQDLELQATEKSTLAHETSAEDNTEPEVVSFVNTAKTYATGALTASLMFTALLQLLVARWWQMIFVNPAHLRTELYHIRLSPMAGLVFLAAIILSYFKISLAQDLLPILYLTFCIAGLSLIHHTLAKFTSLSWLWLFVFYTILLCSWMVYHLPLAFQLVAFMGLLDVWFDWRERLEKRFK